MYYGTVPAKTWYTEQFQLKVGNADMNGIKHDTFNAGN